MLPVKYAYLEDPSGSDAESSEGTSGEESSSERYSSEEGKEEIGGSDTEVQACSESTGSEVDSESGHESASEQSHNEWDAASSDSDSDGESSSDGGEEEETDADDSSDSSSSSISSSSQSEVLIQRNGRSKKQTASKPMNRKNTAKVKAKFTGKHGVKTNDKKDGRPTVKPHKGLKGETLQKKDTMNDDLKRRKKAAQTVQSTVTDLDVS